MRVWELEPGAWPHKLLWRIALLGAATAALASCASTTTSQYGGNGREHFSSSKYGPASARVVAYGQRVPRGGGQYLVGRPYVVAGRTYYPSENTSYSAIGMASWYGSAFHGRRTANGEVYDMASLSAAHPTMPLPSYARVTNLTNGYSVIVRVNDRGPFHGGRVMDVSSRVADVLEFKGAGTAKIRVDYMGRAPMEGSDDGRLLASLRTDGRLAALDGIPLDDGTMVAEQAPNPPRPEPQPQPQPVRVALAAPAFARPPEPQEAAQAFPAPAPSGSYAAPAHAPLPPSRPFDLGAIPDAAIPVAAATPALPPRRPIIQASAERALYFAPPTKLDSTRGDRDPFARLKAAQAVLPPPRP